MLQKAMRRSGSWNKSWRRCSKQCNTCTVHVKVLDSFRVCWSWGHCRWVAGLVASAAFCTAVLVPMMGMPLYEPLAAVVLALLVAVLAVRALGETDLNPVSGVGKLSQVSTLGHTWHLQPCHHLKKTILLLCLLSQVCIRKHGSPANHASSAGYQIQLQ